MRLTLLALIGVLCLAYSYAAALEDNNNQIVLLDLADEGQAHENEGEREVRQWGGGWGGGWGRPRWGGGWGHHHHHHWGGRPWGGYYGGWGGGWGGGYPGYGWY